MNNDDQLFVARRATLLRQWRYVGPALLIVIVGLAIYLWFSAPMLINPWAVIAQLEAGSLDRVSLETAASILPVVTLLVFTLLLLVAGFMYAAFRNERRYQRMLNSG